MGDDLERSAPVTADRSRCRVLVVGAGLGGLAAAVALRRRGFTVDVVEQAPVLTEVGGGINVGANAAGVLIRLGLGEALERVAVRPAAAHVRRWQDGTTLQRNRLNPRYEEVFGAPHLTAHRAELLDVLVSGLAGATVHLGRRLTAVTDTGDGVEAVFVDGERAQADVLVGADGINSTVRALLFGEEHPIFAGCVAYRGLVPVERLAGLDLPVETQSWLGPGGHLVHYPVSAGRVLNFVGWTEHDTWNREDWTDRATIERALAAFEGWHPQVRRIIAAADTCFIWALFDRDPLPRWSAGRVTLLGDACHPMYPFMAQGAAQAMEDGACLAACLAAAVDDGGDLAAALVRYEQVRLPRTSRLQELSRANKTVFHLPDGEAQQARDAEWAAAGERSPEAMRWLFGHDPFDLTGG